MKRCMPDSRFYECLDVSDQVVLVTGATSGIGQKIAVRFAELGCTVHILGRRGELLQKLQEELCALLPDSGSRVIGHVVDVTDVEGLQKVVEAVGPVDILVNNAGLALGTSSADETPYSDLFTMVNTNLVAAAHLTQLVGKGMKDRGKGHVVFISSVASRDFYEGGSVYCATKAGMTAYAFAYRCDVAKTPVRVTCISPGLCETAFSEVRFKGDKEKAKRTYEGICALDPMDVADQVIYSVTRPRNVQIADIVCYCTNQGHAKYCVERVGKDGIGALP